jgi:hypothetical protein
MELAINDLAKSKTCQMLAPSLTCLSYYVCPHMYAWHAGEILWGTSQSQELNHSRGPGVYVRPTGTILHGENEVFQSNRNYFPKVTFTLDGI